jgi:hypothetical protein
VVDTEQTAAQDGTATSTISRYRRRPAQVRPARSWLRGFQRTVVFMTRLSSGGRPVRNVPARDLLLGSATELILRRHDMGIQTPRTERGPAPGYRPSPSL